MQFSVKKVADLGILKISLVAFSRFCSKTKDNHSIVVVAALRIGVDKKNSGKHETHPEDFIRDKITNSRVRVFSEPRILTTTPARGRNVTYNADSLTHRKVFWLIIISSVPHA